MSKIIKNTTGSPIVLKTFGQTVPATSQLDVDPTDYSLLASPDVIAEMTAGINAGDLVISDGIEDLSAPDGLRYVGHPDASFNIRFLSDPDRSNGFISKNAQEAIEEAKNTIESKMLDFEFSSVGNIANKWLNVGHPSVSSDAVPFIAGWAATAIELVYANANDLAETDLEFYVNGSLAYTWEIRNKRTAWRVSAAGFFTVAQGDRVSVFAKEVAGDKPSNVFGEVGLKAITMPDGEGGTSSGV